jgi:membrane protease YdiL (CAAX protease family)
MGCDIRNEMANKKKSVQAGPLIRPGWLRALIFFLALIILAGVVLVAGFPELLNVNNGSVPVDLLKGRRLIITGLILGFLILILVYVFRRWIDRRSIQSLGFVQKGFAGDAIAGFSLGVFMICASCLLLIATGHLKWTDILFDPRALFLASGGVLVFVFFEELIFRGYLLNNLLDSFPPLLAVLISAVLNMLFHWNPTGFFPMVNVFIMSLITGLYYAYTKNLWFPVLYHFGWKWMLLPVMGFSTNDSVQTLLIPELSGGVNITGGTNSLEGSVVLMAVAIICLLALYLFLQKKFSPQSRPVPGRI